MKKDNKVIMTYHAEDRLKERAGFNQKAANRMAQKALDNGITHGDVTGQLKKWLDRKYFAYKNANNMRIYGEELYIFNEDVLITVFHIPQHLKKQALACQKKKREMEKNN